MYKEKLFEAIEYNVDKITYEQYIKMICKLDEMKESDCKTFFTEQGKATKYRKTTHSVAGVGSGALAVGTGAGFLKYGKTKILKAAEKMGRGVPNELEPLKKFSVGKFATGKAAAITAGAGVALWGGYRGIRAIFDKCTRKCGALKINTPQRQECLTKCKEDSILAAREKRNKEENK